MAWIVITQDRVLLNDKAVETTTKGSEMLTELYRKYVNDYPKFFKMDGLCKLGFIASELLLNSEGTERFVPREDRAVVLCSKAGSSDVDNKYLATISDKDNYYPSPSLFVYTLPNIVTGEIAIRNKYYGETAFYSFDTLSKAKLYELYDAVFCDSTTQSMLFGRLEYTDSKYFSCCMLIRERNKVQPRLKLVKPYNGTQEEQ